VVCDDMRIKRNKLYPEEMFRGYLPSKKRYFYGLKVHLLVTTDGQPVEFFLTHGGFGDVAALKYYAFALPAGSIIYADRAYNDYEIEELLKEVNTFSFYRCGRKTRSACCHHMSLLSSIILAK
jgi:hypothetical protein